MAEISDAMWLAQNIGNLRLVVAAYLDGGVIVTPTPTPPPTDLDPGTPGATTLSFPADRVSGTNPVILATSTVASAPGDLLQVRYGSSSSLDAIAWADAMISTGDEDNEDREFTIDGTLPAGLTYFQARPKRVQDKGGNTIAARYGPPSNIISDTLQGTGPTPTPGATTTWDATNKSAAIQLSSDNRTATFIPGGDTQMIVSSEARNTARYAEYIVTAFEARGDNIALFGVVDAATIIANGRPTEYAVTLPLFDSTYQATLNAAIAANDAVFTIIFTPATAGNTDGTVKVLFRGQQVDSTIMHPLTNLRLYAIDLNGLTVRLNTGQEAFSYAPTDSAFTRYN